MRSIDFVTARGKENIYCPEGYKYIQGVPGGKDLSSGDCSLGQTIPI